MKRSIFCLFLLIFMGSCENKSPNTDDSKIVHLVGEIFHDKKQDGDFEICNDQSFIVQYYLFGEKTYEGEKLAIVDFFKENYKPIHTEESGLVRIRFVVNCKGEAGRFRMLQMDKHYEPKTFPAQITDQLMTLTKDLKSWKAMKANNIARDYYQYLIFKIEKGEIIEILP